MAQSPSETRETRLRRLHMRSWRRGMKEMDLILGGFADTGLAALSDAQLDAHEAMMAQNDQDLYLWVTGAVTPPAAFADAIQRVAQTLPK